MNGSTAEKYLQVSKALRTIRDERLFRGEFETFEEYVRVKHGLDPRMVNDSFRVADSYATMLKKSDSQNTPQN